MISAQRRNWTEKGATVKAQYVSPEVEAQSRRPGAGIVWVRRVYLGLAAIFWLGIVAQAFLAGAGLFAGGAWMTAHVALGHLLTSLPLLPLLLLALSIVGRLPRADRWWCAALHILTVLQPVPLYMRGSLPLLAAIHPVNALLLFALPTYLIARALRLPSAAGAAPEPGLTAE